MLLQSRCSRSRANVADKRTRKQLVLLHRTCRLHAMCALFDDSRLSEKLTIYRIQLASQQSTLLISLVAAARVHVLL